MGIDTLSAPDHLKESARTRLETADEYIDNTSSLSGVVRPGRMIIVDLRDEFIGKDEALGLFVVLLQLFADAQFDDRDFNKCEGIGCGEQMKRAVQGADQSQVSLLPFRFFADALSNRARATPVWASSG